MAESIFPPISLFYIPITLLLPLCPISPKNTSHLSAVEGSSFPRRCCFARSALSPFPQAGQDSQLCPAGLCLRDVPVVPPNRAHCMGGTGLQAPQPGGDVARRLGDHPNITHGQWPDPLGGAELSVPLLGWVGVSPQALEQCWPRSRVGTHVLSPWPGGLRWEGGLERRQMFEPKNVHYCLKLLRAAREAALAPRGKPQSRATPLKSPLQELLLSGDLFSFPSSLVPLVPDAVGGRRRGKLGWCPRAVPLHGVAWPCRTAACGIVWFVLPGGCEKIAGAFRMGKPECLWWKCWCIKL